MLVIDEPIIGLDPTHARIVKDEFKATSRAGMTIFLSTRQFSIAEELADRVGIITPQRSKHSALNSARGRTAQLHSLDGITSFPDSHPQISSTSGQGA